MYVVAGATERLPLWLAPNLITLTGVAGLVVAYVVAFIYLPGFEGIERERVPSLPCMEALASGAWR